MKKLVKSFTLYSVFLLVTIYLAYLQGPNVYLFLALFMQAIVCGFFFMWWYLVKIGKIVPEDD